MIKATDFTKTEIIDISKYITNNVPFSILEQVFPLTENTLNKAEIFTTVYRLIYSSYGYVQDKDTKIKLNNLLNDCKKEYIDVYKILSQHKNATFNKTHFVKKLTYIFQDINSTEKINNLIDVFLVFAEKHMLRDIDKVFGISADTPPSQKIVEEMSKTIN